jgi:hypothetical protein
MAGRCPLCGQPLPAAISHANLQDRLHKLTSPALAAEKRRLKDEFEAHLIADREMARQRAERRVEQDLRAARERAQRAEEKKEQEVRRLKRTYSERLARESKSAKREAQNEVRKQLLEAEKRATDAEDQRQDAEDQRQKEVARVRREMATRVDKESKAKMEKFLEERRKEKLRDEGEKERLRRDVDDLRRKLENQSGEQLGAEAELDLLTELRRAFPGDKVDPVGRGIKGADIVHEVRESGRIVGQIVYESKNTSGWNKAFIAQAKKYQTQYETPHVIIVTRVLPPKQKGLCVVRGIPIIQKHMAVPLVTVIREGIIEIARLRLSGRSRDEKSQELYQYIVGDRFGTRFREIADGISSLREQQRKERTWHENVWETEKKTHERIEGRHREVEAQIRAIVGRGSNGASRKPAAKSEEWAADLINLRHA